MVVIHKGNNIHDLDIRIWFIIDPTSMLWCKISKIIVYSSNRFIINFRREAYVRFICANDISKRSINIIFMYCIIRISLLHNVLVGIVEKEQCTDNISCY